MAKIGLIKPIAAPYSASGSTISYGTPIGIGKFTELSIDVESNDNILYGDDEAAEIDTSFSGGTAGVTTTDLSPAAIVSLLGLQETTVTGGSGAKWVEFDDRQNVPYVGLGGIIVRQVDGVKKYQAFILPKIKFSNPALSVTTRGQSIEWQTQQISAKIVRDDSTNHRWFRLSTYVDSEDAAQTLLNTEFGVSASVVNGENL